MASTLIGESDVDSICQLSWTANDLVVQGPFPWSVIAIVSGFCWALLEIVLKSKAARARPKRFMAGYYHLENYSQH
jgi:hypothetical protein